MSRVLKELTALGLVLAVGAGVVFLILRLTAGNPPSPYDTFQAIVNTIPLQIISPAAGQVFSMPSGEGSPVAEGQLLVTVQVFDRNYRPPADSQMFKLQGDQLQIFSPASGIVGRMQIAPLSAVVGNQLLMHLLTPQSTDLQVLIPQDSALSRYRDFYAATSVNAPRYQIQILGTIPSEIVVGVAPATTVYRATCQAMADCGNFLTVKHVEVFAQISRP
jgi:hypothetical protein